MPRKHAVALTPHQLRLMNVLWDRQRATVAEIVAALDPPPLAYTTVMTTLGALESKGYVAHTEEGKAHRFRATVKRDDAGATATARVVEKLFGGSTERMMTHLVTERSVTAAELKRLRQLLDDKLREIDK